MYVDRLVAFEQPYLARNSERQLLMYSMDKRVRFSILLLTLVSQKNSREVLNFIFLGYPIDYLRDYRLFIFKFSPRNSHFLRIHKSFLPQKFTAIRYITHHYLITTEK